jgi:ADP-ribosyl-[dinitrogen reductase] hydrolase
MPPASALGTEAGLSADLRRRAQGAYLGLAVGDALGATVEFMIPREIRAQYGEHRDMIGGGWLRLPKGRVTDDTEMSLALGDAILASGGRVEPAAVAAAFDSWMRSKPVDIGNTVRRGIVHYRRTGRPEVPEHDYDAGNGACMRTLPVALVTLGAGEREIAAASWAQAHVTHHNCLSDAGCEAVIRMLHAALQGRGRAALEALALGLAATWPQFRFTGPLVSNPSAFIVETLQVVLQCLFAHDDFEATLVAVVNRGGDADTTGAIAGMLAGALYGPEAIPRCWLKTLDPGTRAACEAQAAALLDLVSRTV